MNRSSVAAGVLVVVVGLTIGGGVVSARSGNERPTFGLSPAGKGDQAPAFSAVSDQNGGIAGYVNTELINSGGPQPETPEEAVIFMKTVKGNIYEVFDTDGEIVGYFASEGHGFVGESERDELIKQGFRLLRAPRPELDGSSVPSPTQGDAGVPAPTTQEP